MTTIQVQVKDPARCTRSAFLGYFGLSPGPTREEKQRLDIIDAEHRLDEQRMSRRGLSPWMLTPCFQDRLPSECLLGVDGCRDAKFCLRQRLTEYARRDEA
jgi:hypothetical protein